MATISAIKIKTDEHLRRIVRTLGPALIVPKRNNHTSYPHEHHLMQMLGALADALDPDRRFADPVPGGKFTPTPNTADETEAEKDEVLA